MHFRFIYDEMTLLQLGRDLSAPETAESWDSCRITSLLQLGRDLSAPETSLRTPGVMRLK